MDSGLHRWVLRLLALVLAGAPPVWAAVPTIDRYKHFHWTVEDGAPSVSGLAQSADGYLWIASASGLFRFDGVTFEQIPALDASTEYDPVTAVAPARGGGVWVGYRNNGVARYSNGRLIDLKFPKGVRQIQITAIVEGSDGALWVTVGRPDRVLWRYARGRWEAIDARWGFDQLGSTSLMIDHNDTLWIACSSKALLYLPPGAHRFLKAPVTPVGYGGVAEDLQGRVWYLDDAGMRLAYAPTATRFYPTPGVLKRPTAIFAADGSVWGTTWTKGIFRVAAPMPTGPKSREDAAASIEFFNKARGLSSDSGGALLSDREGNVWIGTSRGLDMFRPADIVLEETLAVPTLNGDNLATDMHGNVYVGQEKALWRIPPGGLPEIVLRTSNLSALCPGRSDDIWVVLPEGIQRFSGAQAKTIPRPQMSKKGAAYDCAVDRYGTLWVTGGADGLYRWSATGWTNYPTNPSAPNANPTIITTDADIRIVTRYRTNFLSIIDYPLWTAIKVGGSEAMNDARTLYSGRSGLMTAGDFGLTRWKGGRIQRLPATIYPWLTGIRGIAQTRKGETWLMARAGAMRIATADLERAFAQPGTPLPVRVFDVLDGMPDSFASIDFRSVVEGGDGRLWFATTAGTAWLDPKLIRRNSVVPTVLIRALVTGGQSYRDPANLKLAAGTSAVEIGYTATSLSIPQRVHFRYRLVGVDAGWVDPSGRRQAFYTNLNPGTYVFEVVASNNDGLWNRRAAILTFEIAPTFLQSRWFFALCAVACLALLWLAYSLRLRQVSAKLRHRLEERLGERERIARELHDTLLQGIQGLILRFQAIADRIPPDQPTRDLMEKALDRADEIMVEGRDRVSNLRSAESPEDLREMLVDAATAATADTSLKASVVTEGQPRGIYAVTADEIASIAREALFNAVMHAQASVLDVSVGFGRQTLEVRIADDGIGLDQGVLEAGGRTGHYGLIGMRERAERIHAQLTLRSRPGAGTEVTLSVPAAYAYATKWRGWRGKEGLESHDGK